jgi:putative endonuclease
MYILKCADDSYYTGSTTDLERRFWQHQNGLGANYTKKRLPVQLVYYEEFSRIDEAFYREKQVQGWSRKKKEALIKERSFDLPLLSKNYTEYGELGLRQAQLPEKEQSPEKTLKTNVTSTSSVTLNTNPD